MTGHSQAKRQGGTFLPVPVPLPLTILAAGRGARMDPLTRSLPKPLLPVANEPLLRHLIRNAVQAGFQDLTLVVHHGAKQIQDTLGDGSDLGCAIRYVMQEKPRGTGDAVAALDGHVEGDFVLVSGDSLLSPEDLGHLAAAGGLAVGGRPVQDTSRYGLLSVDDGLVTGVLEKPPGGGSGIANAGAYRLDGDFVAACKALKPSPRGELELTDALQQTIEGRESPLFVACHSWLEAGYPWDLLDLQEAVMQDMPSDIRGDVGERVDVEGHVVVAEGARVINGSRIEGPVAIGPDATIGPNAYLRPHTAIGAGCHIGNGCEVKGSIVMDRSNVPHLSYVGDSVIGRDCNLGAGTQVANLKITPHNVRVHLADGAWIDSGRRKLGVIMGDDVKTGVNASIHPGTVVAPGVRVPAGAVASGWMEPEKE